MNNSGPQRKIYDRIADCNAEDSLGKIFRRIPQGAKILDVGVGCGALGAMIQNKNNQQTKDNQQNNFGASVIDGIDLDRGMLQQARPYYNDLFQADIDRCSASILGERRYDVIVLADVIEHLQFPSKALSLLSRHLHTGGKILFSVPNVTYLGVICELASGNFRYRDEGLLDKTHLRFFSHQSLVELISDAGLDIVYEDTVEMPLELSEFKDHDASHYLNLDSLSKNPHLMTYQFIVEAVSSA